MIVILKCAKSFKTININLSFEKSFFWSPNVGDPPLRNKK